MSKNRIKPSLWDIDIDHEKVSNYFPKLSSDTNCEVCIIGGGITGVSLAYILAGQGRDVVLLEAEHIGAGATGATSAHLDPLTDLRPSDLLERYGEKESKAILDSNFKAMNFIEAISRNHALSAEFKKVPGSFVAFNEDETKLLERELKACEKLGLKANLQNFVSDPMGIKAKLSFNLHARFHPTKYLFCLAKAARQRGARIFQNSMVKEINDEKAILDKVSAKAQIFVMATHMPFGLHPIIQSRVYPYRSYMVMAKVKDEFPDELIWDLQSPYHYMRRVGDGKENLVLIGGADHRTGEKVNTLDAYERLKNFARAKLKVESFELEWSGQFYLSSDGLPYIGKVSPLENIYYATGFEGNGLTFGTIAAQIIGDEILEVSNTYSKLYSPTRLNIASSGKRFIGHNLTTAKDFILDRFGGDQKSPNDLKEGEGEILFHNGEQIACYKDEESKIHALSPVCPHAKCHVRWNNSEKSWDCPCHGGRFTATGELLQGPPTEGLKCRDDIFMEDEWEEQPPI